MLKNSPVNPTFTNMHPFRCFGYIKTCSKLEKFLGSPEHWPEALRRVKENGDELAFQAMGMTVSFLEDTLIAERTLRPGLFFNYSPESTTEELEHMVLDS